MAAANEKPWMPLVSLSLKIGLVFALAYAAYDYFTRPGAGGGAVAERKESPLQADLYVHPSKTHISSYGTAGKLNGLDSKADRAAIKRALPCFTGETPDGKKIGGIEANCGGGVFFTRDHFYFYTGRDYIEVRTGFKGKVGGDLLGASRKTVEGEVGTPNRVEKVAPRTIALYAMTYGTLAVTYDQDGKAIALAAHSTPAQDIKLCK